MYFDTRDYESNWRNIYKLAITFVQPRPIALVSSMSPDGVRNLAPFSFYNMVSGNPPVVMFCPSYRRDSTEKDSLHNVESTGEFVVATVSEQIVERMNRCAYDYTPDVDEFEKSGLTPRPASLVAPPLVADSPANIECKLIEIKRFGTDPGAGNLVFGQIVAIHVDDTVLADDGLPDPAQLQAIGRLGRWTYCKTTDIFDLPRPTQP
ncbi:MAG: flavin reductase family protein [Phycisphaerales bacterium]|nr:MAG: flavin reductase family protein [Phycisphaerales bacterium]